MLNTKSIAKRRSNQHRSHGLAAIEHVIAEFLHLKDSFVGPTLWQLRLMNFRDLSNYDVVVSQFNDLSHHAFYSSGSAIKQWGTVCSIAH